MKNVRKLTLLLTLITISMFSLVFTASAQDDTWLKVHDTDTVEYKFDEVSGILTIRSVEGKKGVIRPNYCDSMVPIEDAGGDDGFVVDPEYNPTAIKNFVDKIKILIIEDGVTTIGYHAFSGVDSLEIAILPDSVDTIYYAAFYHCTSLKSVILPQKLKYITSDMFRGCKNLSSITLPNSIESISEFAFCGCKSLTSIGFSSNLKVIHAGAFSGSGLEYVYIPENVELDCEYTDWEERIQHPFSGCDNLKKIVFTNDVCEMYDCALLEEIVYPADFSFEYKNGDDVYDRIAINCPNLKKITFPADKKVANIKINPMSYDVFLYDCPNAVLGYVNRDMIEKNDVNYAVVTKGVSSLGTLKNVKFTQKGATKQITWSALENAGYYQLYYYNNSKWEKIYIGEKLSYNVTKSGKYRVRAVNYDGTKYVYSKYVTLEVKLIDKVTLSSTKSTTSIKLTWKKLNNVTGYQVYYSTTSSSSGFKKLTNVTGTSYTVKNLTKGKTYYYKVRAYRKESDGRIQYGEFSNIRTF